jgi:hypothetical protein
VNSDAKEIELAGGAPAANILRLIQSMSRRTDHNSAQAWQDRHALTQARERLRQDFAASRGWIMARTSFTAQRLAAGHNGSLRDESWSHRSAHVIDHPECFREPTRPYRPAALITHTYGTAEEVHSYAQALGLIAETLAWSWYYPGQCAAVLLTRAR